MKALTTLLLTLSLTLAACSTQKAEQDRSDGDTTAAQPADGTAAIGERCGTIAGITCGEDAFCDIESPGPGDDLSGTCKARPEACPDIAMDPMACGRDGKRHATECHANAIGVDIVTEGIESVCPDS